MIHVQAAIEIQASPAEVFRLLCDPELKARLNPGVEVLYTAQLTPGPLAAGSRIFYRLRVASGVCEFHCDVTALESGRLIEWQSDTRPAFRVRQTVEPTAKGCRLIHDEWLETAAPAPARRKWSLADIAGAFQHAAGLELSFRNPEDERYEAMQRSLNTWLENIRTHLEPSPAKPDDDFDAITTVAF